MSDGLLGRAVRSCWIAGAVLTACGFAGAARADDALADELASKVEIRRDTWGVPHVLAKTEEAAYFAQGYACAEDHCLVMARLYLKARAEEAAHFGAAFAENDFLVKQVRVREVAAECYPKLPPWVRRILEAYALGYNRYVTKHRAELPGWVTPVTGLDILAHARRVVVLDFSMDRGVIRQLQTLGPKAAVVEPKKQEEEDPSLGSNMWAIHKDRSASGKALLLGNPHLPWEGQFFFYESHLTVPGQLNLMGATLVGNPGVTLGFNDHLGWSLTVNAHDSDDIYEVTLTEDGKHYLYDGRPLPLAKEELTVRVKTNKGVETRKKEVLRSHYGPTIRKPLSGNKALAWKSANFDACDFVEQWYLMGKAKNLREFRRALDMGAAPMFNICYADAEGNCFYLFNGRFPDRPPGHPWEAIVPGGTSATEWNRMLPQARLPFLLNPPGGYVQNCNSSPWYTNLKAPIDRRQFPDDLTFNFNSLRQQHSLLMLNGDEKLSLDEVMKRKYATKLLLADRVKEDVLKAARGQSVNGVDLGEAVKLLEAWDNTASRGSKGGVLFTEFWDAYTKSFPVTKRADLDKFYRVPWDEKRPAETPVGIGNEESARKALAAAVKATTAKYGKLDVAWGDVHRLRRGDLDVPIGGFSEQALGDYGPFRVVGYGPPKGGKRVATGGDSYVFAVEFTNPPTAYSISAYSQSSDPKSPHHADQSALFAAEKWKRAWFTEEDIAKNTTRTYRP
ncbi:MAG TPA: penicillin acylase family protein [Fimbriiglobus sp.]|jgi:acyl-homoserine-lactone acylase|nr:penicillin acylase family protein [Fimbriiglobus sp.]